MSVTVEISDVQSRGLISKTMVFGLMLALVTATMYAAHSLEDAFALDGSKCILTEEHFGIVNGKMTIGVNYTDVAAVQGLWAPPYASSDFALRLTAGGQKVKTTQYVWRPHSVTRTGCGVVSDTETWLAPGHRGGAITMKFSQEAPVEVSISGTLDRIESWEFARAASSSKTLASPFENGVVFRQGALAIVVLVSGADAKWDAARGCLEFRGRNELSIAFAMGPESEAVGSARAIAAAPGRLRDAMQSAAAREAKEVFARLPEFESDSEEWVRFYHRSLVHFIMNRWDVPEFVLHPYYSTGSVKGGCVCDYLWNFGENWEILPLYDARAAREHIKQFLKTDMTRHFAFNPVDGKAFGPWYPVNQEKILGMIYYYVLNSGDMAFLNEEVDGKTILEHAVWHAQYGDDATKPATLMDYGPSNSHLELRRGFPYNHVMPDLNGRRYMNFQMAAALCDWAGKPMPALRERAEALKGALKQALWNREKKWFYFRDDNGNQGLRYTVQIFKLFGSGVLDREEDEGLLSHLNEVEFLSPYGLHSLSKTDIAYDPADIDNGGPGACTCFPPQIAERLYKAGHPAQADDILRRCLWWGDRMPYWGDSLVADKIDYRKDTPLQCTIDGATVAQCIIFGLFGVKAEANGRLIVNPHLPAGMKWMKLNHLKLRGHILTIEVGDGNYRILPGYASRPLGQPTEIPQAR